MGAGERGVPAAVAASPPATARNDRQPLAHATGRWLVERRLVLASGLVAALPIVFSIVHAVSVGWLPLGDDAAVALRSYDVLTDRSPLVGLPSTGPTGVLDEQAYHLGPLLFWLLALPAHYMGPSALVVTVGLVNVASVIGVVALAKRRGGLPLMFAVAVALPVMLTSLPTEAYSDVWNPAAPLLPFTVLIFVAWSLACGDYRLLPLAVLCASFAAQCHLTYLLPSLGSLVVGIVGLELWRRREERRRRARQRRARADRAGHQPGPASEMRRWIVAAVVVGIACWSAPLIDLATSDHANLVLLWEAAMSDQPALGPEKGLRALAFTVGVLPWWLRDPRVAIERVSDLLNPLDAQRVASALLVLAAVVVVMYFGRRRRRHDVVAAGALALVLCVALVQFTASVPAASFASVGYGLWWASPAGMFVWLALGWSLATLLPARRLEASARRLVPDSPPALPTLAGFALVLTTGVLVAVGAEWRKEPYEAMKVIGARLNAALPARPTRVDSSAKDAPFLALGLQTGIVNSLRRDGRDDVTAPAIESSLGPEYGSEGAEPEQVVRVDVDTRPPAGGRVIVRRIVVEHPEPGNPFAPNHPLRRMVTVTVTPIGAYR